MGLDKLIDVVYDGCDYLELDSETSGLVPQDEKMLMLQLSNTNGEWLIDLRETQDWSKFKRVCLDRSVTKIAHNIKFDGNMLRYHFGVEILGVYDTMIGERLINGDTNISASLYETVKRHLGIELDKDQQTSFIGMTDEPFTDEQLEYGTEDIRHLNNIRLIQLRRAEELDLVKLVKLEMRVTEVLIDMESHGIPHNKETWVEVAQIAAEKAAKLKIDLDEMSGGAVANWNSPAQIKDYFAANGVVIDSLTDLKKMKNPPESIKLLMEYKKQAKRSNAFGEKWLTTKVTTRKPIILSETNKRGRVHASYNQIVSTGRFSCARPNMQQIPKAQEYRDCFNTQGTEWRMATGDFSGQELAILAVLAQEESWLEVLRSGGDLHGFVGSKMFAGWDEMTDDGRAEARSKVKGINFGIPYGLSYKSYASDQGITAIEGKMLYNDYAKAFPKIMTLLNTNARAALETGMSTSMEPFNRYRTFEKEPDWRKKNLGRNNKIQSTGADMTKLAMVLITDEVYRRGWRDLGFLVGQIHDELISVCHESIAAEFGVMMQDKMEAAAQFILKEKLISSPVEVSDKWEK